MVNVTGEQRSSRIMSVANCNALAELPSRDEVEGGVVRKGDIVNAVVVDWI